MAKKGKAKVARKPTSFWSVWILLAVAGVATWFGFRRTTLSSPPAAETEDVDERASLIRDALFDAEGKPSYASGGSGKGVTRFSDEAYWENRYSKSSKDYDWYGTWNSESAVRIKPFVRSLLPTNLDSVLNIGCGSSRFAEELSEDGIPQIMSIDISKTVIEKMHHKFAGQPGIQFKHMDATAMEFPSGNFDIVFEKGTLDAMYTGALPAVEATVKEVFRVLRPGGAFVSISFGGPKSRQQLHDTGAGAWAAMTTIALRKNDGVRVPLGDVENMTKESGSEFFYVYVLTKPS